MKALVPAMLVSLSVVTSSLGQAPIAPTVCLASVDDKDNVRLRSFVSSPVTEATAKYPVVVGGKLEERSVKIGFRVASETILTIGIKGLDAFLDDQPIGEKKLRELLEKETPVLVAGQKPAPAVQKIIKKGTLLLISPVPPFGHGAPQP